MEADHDSHHQHAGPGRLMAAVSAALLLTYILVTGIVPAADPVGMAAGLNSGEPGSSPAFAVDDAGRLAVWNRSSIHAKANRSQPLAGAGTAPGISLPAMALPCSRGLGRVALAVIGMGLAADRHAAADGHLSRRTPTGPPSLSSPAV